MNYELPRAASPIAALANQLKCTLTVEQARQLFAHHGRKVPAVQTLQNYCTEDAIAAEEIRMTYGAEWLINEASLLAFIEQQSQLTHAVASDASHRVPAQLRWCGRT